MPLKNTKTGYGQVAFLLHWVVLIGVVAMFWFGLQAEWAGEAGDRARRGALMGTHISLGMVMVAIVALRIVWMVTTPRPDPVEQARPLQILTAAVHGLLLLALIILVVSGPMAVWSGGRAINVFDVVSLPSPFAARNEGLHEAAEAAHAVGRFMLFGLVPLHVLAALKHVIFDRGPGRFRMFTPA